MKKFAFLTISLIVLIPFSSRSFAQSADDPGYKPTWAQAYGAFGSTFEDGRQTATVHIGAGFEKLLAAGFGVGMDVGYATPLERFADGLGIFSPGVVYAFSPERRTVPFVTGGYSLFFRDGTAHGIYFGGGVNRWVSRRFGFRVEARDQVLPEYNSHLVEGRFSLLVR